MSIRNFIASAGVMMLVAGCGFATTGSQNHALPGFWLGVWHGLLAPWALLLRLFFDIAMYAYPNIGWLYDLGFLLGVSASLPVGWIAAIIATLVHLF